MNPITIGQLEAAINRARAAQPALGHEATLSSDVGRLASIYGRMIFERRQQLDPAGLARDERELLAQWVVP